MNLYKPEGLAIKKPKTPEQSMGQKIDELLLLRLNPHFDKILQEESLAYLKEYGVDGISFDNYFKGEELDHAGCLTEKDECVTDPWKPWRYIGKKEAMLEILRKTKERVEKEERQKRALKMKQARQSTLPLPQE